MSSTTFVDLVTPIPASWLNDVNRGIYTDIGGPGGLSQTTGSALIGTPALVGFPGTNVKDQLAQMGTAIITGGGGGGAGVASFNGRIGVVTLNGADVTAGLGYNVPNQLNAVLLGIPVANTQPTATNDNSLATTQFVRNAITAYAPGGGGSGVVSFNTRTGAVTLTNADTTAAIGFAPAPIASPTFTGTPTVPTAAPGTNTTQAASTAFVTAAVVASTTGVASYNGRTGAVAGVYSDVSKVFNNTNTEKRLVWDVAEGGGSVNAGNSNSIYIKRNAQYAGGGSQVNAAIYAETHTSNNNASFEWGITSWVYSNSNELGTPGVSSYPQNVAMQGTMIQTGTAPCFAANFNANAPQVIGASSGAIIGMEVNVGIGGVDSWKKSVGIDMITQKAAGSGQAQPYTAIRVSGDANSCFQYGYMVGANGAIGVIQSSFYCEGVGGQRGLELKGTYALAMDTSNATITSNTALRVHSGHFLSLEQNDGYGIRYDSGKIEFWNRNTGVRHGYVDMNTGADVAFGAGGGGGVASFNTRTGSVVLTATDVTNALTYIPLSPTQGVGVANTQTITGAKTFTNTAFMNGGLQAAAIFCGGDMYMGTGATINWGSSGNIRPSNTSSPASQLRVVIDGTPYYLQLYV